MVRHAVPLSGAHTSPVCRDVGVVLAAGRDPKTGRRQRETFTVRGTKRDAEREAAERTAAIARGTYSRPVAGDGGRVPAPLAAGLRGCVDAAAVPGHRRGRAGAAPRQHPDPAAQAGTHPGDGARTANVGEPENGEGAGARVGEEGPQRAPPRVAACRGVADDPVESCRCRGSVERLRRRRRRR